MFCPKCGDEFVAGIRVCPDCSLSLVDAPPPRDDEKRVAHEALVTVATFPNVFDASVAKGALEAHGVRAFVPDENAGSFSRAVSHELWAELKVEANDRDRAERLLKRAGQWPG